jgi:hypothetical protein
LKTWERLANLKESNSIEVAEYVVTRGIEDEPAFTWCWVPYTLEEASKNNCCRESRISQEDTQVWNMNAEDC